MKLQNEPKVANKPHPPMPGLQNEPNTPHPISGRLAFLQNEPNPALCNSIHTSSMLAVEQYRHQSPAVATRMKPVSCGLATANIKIQNEPTRCFLPTLRSHTETNPTPTLTQEDVRRLSIHKTNPTKVALQQCSDVMVERAFLGGTRAVLPPGLTWPQQFVLEPIRGAKSHSGAIPSNCNHNLPFLQISL